MEFAFSELLTREDILRILNSRHLNIPNLCDLNQHELMHIYKKFIIPLSRRPLRNRKLSTNQPSLDIEIEDEMDVDIILDPCTYDLEPMTTTYVQHNQQESNIGKINMLNEKRRQRDICDDIINDYQLISATKRIKINSSK